MDLYAQFGGHEVVDATVIGYSTPSPMASPVNNETNSLEADDSKLELNPIHQFARPKSTGVPVLVETDISGAETSNSSDNTAVSEGNTITNDDSNTNENNTPADNVEDNLSYDNYGNLLT